MGICLDTEQNKDELESRSGVRSRRDSAWPDRATPPAASFPMQNSSHVKFEPPNVPVIFVLGGPGSGKVTHCDNLMQERRGMVHINMTDLLQQYAVGNNMQDFGNLSSTTVAEVLMLEMKMAPTAKTYLVSGYPRSMRDVAEYTEKIQTITGVVLVSWRKRVLERQIEYGARLGHVVLSLARMELDNFYGHVMPVAEYFDQSGMLIAVNGERNPEDVYEDFRTAILQILGSVEEPNLNGISGVGADGIPGEIVGIEPAPVRNRERHVKSRGEVRNPGLDVRSRGRDVRDAEVVDDPLPAAVPVAMPNGNMARIVSPKPEVIKVRGTTTRLPTLWVVGGPGSNKATLCQRAVLQRQGWMHFSLGQRLRALAEAGGGPGSEGALARAAVSGGEPAAGELAARLVRAAAGEAARLHCGLLLDGFPRDLQQMHMFQDEFHVTPRMVLLDCSKLQLGRGRRDDSVAAFRRRLEVFREHSLPMLKTLDQHHRLVIVDGDTDSTEVQAEFTRVLLEEMEKAEAIAEMPEEEAQTTNINAQPHAQLTHNIEESTLQRIAALPRQQNGSLPNGVVHNGFIPNNKVKPIANVTKISTISQMTHDDVKRLYQQSTGEVSLNTHHI